MVPDFGTPNLGRDRPRELKARDARDTLCNSVLQKVHLYYEATFNGMTKIFGSPWAEKPIGAPIRFLEGPAEPGILPGASLAISGSGWGPTGLGGQKHPNTSNATPRHR